MKNSKILFSFLLCLTLAACSPPAPKDARLDLCRHVPAGTRVFVVQGESSPFFSNEIVALSVDTRRHEAEKRKHCGQRLTALPGISDAELVAAIQDTLGDSWQYRDDRPSLSADVRIHLWQSTSRFWPKQYYALISYQNTLQIEKDTQETAIRPLETLYLADSNQVLHGSVVAGIMVSPFLLIGIIGLCLYRRYQRRKAQCRLSSE